ncbi:glycosyltransferase family 39 protein [Lactococcus sp.]|uniref:glycosyltransferase family 39 protein n=1 Tax=Lactococcus sp. TaxID=44273 RepID=UPI0035AE9E3D
MEKRTINKQWYQRMDYWLLAILLLALFLNAWGIWDAGNANAYYTAAVKSMTESWKAFWYASLDPASFITVDKPPVALWFMALSAKIFGLHGWSVVLPSVLFGVANSYLMYVLLRKKFGLWTGRLAAFFMTITPIAVADNRTNNMDTTLIFFLLLAIYFLQKGAEKKLIRYVILSFALVGVAYNVKMLQAFMILPAMLVYYFIAVKLPWKKLLTGFVASLAIGGLVTFSYTAIVDATPASSRPYIGSTQDNSLLDLAFGYNGSERLLGQTTGTGGAFPGMSGSSSNKTNATTGATRQTTNGGPNGASGNAPTGNAPTGNAASNGSMPAKPSSTTGNPPSGNTSNGQMQGGAPKAGGQMGAGGAGGAGGAFNIGTAGPLRIFESALGTMASWLLPTAIIGLFVGFFASRRRKQKWYVFNEKQQETILWAGWLIPVAGFFSIAGFFHPYYLIMLAPAIAALAAIGLVEAIKKVHASDTKYNWAHYSLAVMILSTFALQAYYAWSYYPIAVVMIGLVAIGAAGWWFIPKGDIRYKAGLTVVVLSLLTGWWALTPTLAHESAQIPTVGPSLLTSQQANTDISGSTNQKVLDYVEKNQGSATYLFATTDASTAAPYIISSGKSVMALGGFNGTDPSITLAQFKTLVKEGKIKYFYSGSKGMGGNSENSTGATGEIESIVKWIEANAKKVTSVSTDSTETSSQTTTGASSKSASGFGGGMGATSSGTLYDLTTISNF